MSLSRRLAGRYSAHTPAGRMGIGLLLLGLTAVAQGCSSGRDGDGGNSWSLSGNDSTRARQADAPPPQRPREEWRQPANFEADAPGGYPPRGTYRGGRDPLTQRAEQWPPAAPPGERASVATLPPAAPPPVTTVAAAPAPQTYRTLPPQQPSAVPPAAQIPYAPAASAGTVQVRAGDTLYRIAMAHKVTVQAIMQANGMTSETVKAGQRLVIPGR